jgi:hypothetical protein
VDWELADDRAYQAWKNRLKRATDDGACILAIAAVELRRQLFAHAIALEGSHVDYYLFPKGVYVVPLEAEDLEEAWRLEVSGTICDQKEVEKLLRQKIAQARRGNNLQPGLACVVGFQVKMIVMQTV